MKENKKALEEKPRGVLPGKEVPVGKWKDRVAEADSIQDCETRGIAFPDFKLYYKPLGSK